MISHFPKLMMTEYLLADDSAFENTLTDWDLGCILAVNTLVYVHSRFVVALLVYTFVVCAVTFVTDTCQLLSIFLLVAMFLETVMLKFNLKIPHRFYTFQSVVHGVNGLIQSTKLAFAAVILFGTECVDDVYTAFALWATLIDSVVSLVISIFNYASLLTIKQQPTEEQLYQYRLACIFEGLNFDPETYKVF